MNHCSSCIMHDVSHYPLCKEGNGKPMIQIHLDIQWIPMVVLVLVVQITNPAFDDVLIDGTDSVLHSSLKKQVEIERNW